MAVLIDLPSFLAGGSCRLLGLVPPPFFPLPFPQAGSLVMQSPVLGPAPLTCLAIEPSQPPRLALGAADGSLRLFDLSSLPAARCGGCRGGTCVARLPVVLKWR